MVQDFEIEEKHEPVNKRREVFEFIFYVAIVVICAYLIVHFIGQRTVVEGSSMETTLQDGDNLIVNKVCYRVGEPKRFDIIVFPYLYEDNTYYIKRVIGLPGETVYIDDEGVIYINGKELNEHYGAEIIQNAGLAATPITLAEDEYFVLGDNRNRSEDSRFSDVAEIKRDDIIGKAIFRIYPFDNIGSVAP